MTLQAIHNSVQTNRAVLAASTEQRINFTLCGMRCKLESSDGAIRYYAETVGWHMFPTFDALVGYVFISQV